MTMQVSKLTLYLLRKLWSKTLYRICWSSCGTIALLGSVSSLNLSIPLRHVSTLLAVAVIQLTNQDLP